MFYSVVRVFFTLGICFLSGLQAKKATTCGDLARKIESFEDEIESLKLQLLEYRLDSGEVEDVADECGGSTTCSRCLRTSHFDCGWCTLRNRCSLEKNCPGEESSNFWISASDRCPKIRAVKPNQLAANQAKMLEIIIPYMPDYNGTFICSFEVFGKTLVTKGEKMDRGIKCASPPVSAIPSIPFGNDHTEVALSVRTPNGPNFASMSNFTIYDCRRLNSCTECASSPFPCAWCVMGNKCTHSVSEYCKDDIIIFSKYVARPTLRQGTAYCTRILPQTGLGTEMLVPSGLKKRFHVKVENIQMAQASSRFTCKVSGIPEVAGHLLGDSVYCDTMSFSVKDRQPVSNLSFSVFWARGGIIDNTENLHVVVYHCGLMASSCGECLSLPEKYGCGWCRNTDSCTIRDNCEDISDWMDNKRTCRKPKITSFYPRAVVLTRPTNITIEGINFAKEFKDIEGVSVIDEESERITDCIPYEDLFVKYSKIVCLLNVPELDRNGTLQGFVEVRFSKDYFAISDDELFFVDPSITDFKPVKGIVSGGTLLNIMGNNLDAGNTVEAFIGDLPCDIVSRDSSTIRCLTSPVPTTTYSTPSPRSSGVRVVFDGEERTSSRYYFYVADPYVLSVKSEGGQNGPVGILSGGNLIFVEGGNFDHVPNPYIYVIVDEIEYAGLCTVESDTRMECMSPKIPTEVLNFCDEEGHMTLDYGFKMGDVEELQNISLNKDFRKYRLYPDPYFAPFPEGGKIKVYKAGYVTINGKLLDTVFNEDSITVLIGGKECALTSVSHTQLTCLPPQIHEVIMDDENKLPEVVVKIRTGQEYFIGFLRYDKE